MDKNVTANQGLLRWSSKNTPSRLRKLLEQDIVRQIRSAGGLLSEQDLIEICGSGARAAARVLVDQGKISRWSEDDGRPFSYTVSR